MSESISATIKNSGLTLDSVFVEVQHSEGLNLPKANHIRFFHTAMRGNRLSTDNLQVFLRRNLARYVFSRAQLENYRINDDLDSAVSEAMRIMAENGGSSAEGTGNMLDEILVYAFLEEKLKAPKLMSRVELYTEMAQFRSECKGIHLLSPSDLPQNTKFQMVFGASNIVDDVKTAIDRAFETISKIDSHESREILMVQKTVLDQFFNQEEVALLSDVLIPQPGKPETYDTAYGVFLGYQLGLNPTGRGDDFEALAEQKMLCDIREHAGYISEKISAAGLTGHSFYVYIVPFNDAEQEKAQIMDAVLRGRGSDMNQHEKMRLGDVLFQGIDENDYLNELYKNILYNYAITVLQITNIKQLRGVNVDDALRFADLLSKSTHVEKADSHKIWAHEIITMLLTLYPDDEVVHYYAGSVLTSTGNFMGRKLVQSQYVEPTVMDELFSTLSDLYLTVPAAPEKKFFQQQRKVYEHLDDACFSYSAPTSMGKSFIMRMFIKEQILAGKKKNYALIVPTKALINEVRSEIIRNDLENLLDENQYHVVSSANDMALETHPDHNFVFVLTPERLLYLLNDKPDFVLDYLFIDEAHKMTGRNSRAPFYYSVVDELSRRTAKPKFIFASPNIPNPQEYLSLLASGEYDKQNAIASAFSPVVQFKFLVNLKTKQIYIYNDHLKTLEYICSINANPEDGVIPLMGLFYKNSGERTSRMIAYFSSKDKAINAALTFAELQKQIDGGTQKQIDPELAELARDVRNQVHRDYFLAGLLEQGIAYHIGYLPSAIRMRIEKLFKDEKITAMFCTSTLVEGVNLPADNLFITSYYSGRAQMTDVDFRNLVGRVGRIQYNLSGNVFMISDETRNNKQDVYLDKLKSGIPDQHLSLVQDLKPKHKKRIIEILLSGSSVIDKYNDDQPEEEYIMMRKFGLILLKDILHDNDSLIQQEFRKYMKDGDEEKIKNIFSQYTPIIDSDINISLDQTRKLRAAISADSTFAYPLPEPNGSFNVDEVFGFLIRLGDIFDWKRYEYSTLGKCDEDGDYTKLRWYAVILVQWMEGKGLNYIMRRAVEYQERHPEKFWINRYTKQYYDKNSLEHRNIVFANTLEVIENVILFSISNYFLRFSNEYKRVHGEKSLNRNNWYEYVEYGTTNEVTIQLQRYGFSRESATYIKAHPQYFTVDGEGNVHVKNDLENCGDNEVVQQIPDIRFNTPELFVE